jgi:RNA polymerase sigma-70 factor (ECF subfamily)
MTPEFLDELRVGSPDAYDRLLDRFEDPIYRFFVLSHGKPDLAKEQCVETFGNFVLALPRMRGESSSLGAFLFGIAKNILRSGWRQTIFENMPQEILEDYPDGRPSPFEWLAGRREVERALGALELLDSPGREVMILRFVEQMKIDDIAEALNLPANTVKSHIRRCKKRLVALLEARTGETK